MKDHSLERHDAPLTTEHTSQIMQTGKAVTRISWDLLVCYLEKADENTLGVRGKLRGKQTNLTQYSLKFKN